MRIAASAVSILQRESRTLSSSAASRLAFLAFSSAWISFRLPHPMMTSMAAAQSPNTNHACHIRLMEFPSARIPGIAEPREAIPFCPNRLDHLLGIVAKLLAKPGDVHVHRPCLDSFRGDMPDPRQNLLARNGSAGVHREIAEQIRLHGG